MITHVHRPLRVVLYEGNGAIALPPEARAKVMAALLDKGYAVTRATVEGHSAMPHDDRSLLVLGLFPDQKAPALEDATGSVKIEARDITGLDSEAVLELVEKARGAQPMNQPGTWKPWFPVIDYSRCTNCMQCLSFCLFDVYGVSGEGKIQVQNNDNCKTNCPACSRVCPEVAIMFPKYSQGPINGDVVNYEDLRREKMKVDITSLLGGDIYARLRDRSEAAKSRFSKERSPDKALEERKKCLTKMAQDGFIPAEVLAALPSPDEILRKAEVAKAKADAALGGAPSQA
jgi:Pyruvate/2-oxoacid:ferredoxin oxidoreductase delta subunit